MSEKRCPFCQRMPHIEETKCSESEYQDCLKRVDKIKALKAENAKFKEVVGITSWKQIAKDEIELTLSDGNVLTFEAYAIWDRCGDYEGVELEVSGEALKELDKEGK